MSRKGSIYFLRCPSVEMMKIGISSNPARRLQSIKSGCPFELELIASIPGTLADERALHNHFLADWARGEWFRTSPAMEAIIAEAIALGSIPAHISEPWKQRGRLVLWKCGAKRTPEQRRRIRDGLFAQRARDKARREAIFARGSATA